MAEALLPPAAGTPSSAHIKLAFKLSWAVNWALLGLKVLAFAVSHSKAVLASLNMAPKSATRMMSAAMKCVDSNGATRDTLLSLPQARLEAILTAGLLGHGVTVERGVSMRWPEADEESVVAELMGAAEERAGLLAPVGEGGGLQVAEALVVLRLDLLAAAQEALV